MIFCLANEKKKIETGAAKLSYDPKHINQDICAEIPSYVTKLSELVNKTDDKNTDISTMVSDLICGLAQKDNPFKEFPWDTSKNIFTEILNFGLTHTPDIVKFIATLSKTDSGLDEKSVYKVSFIYSLLVSSASPRTNSAFLKLMTLMLKSSGSTG